MGVKVYKTAALPIELRQPAQISLNTYWLIHFLRRGTFSFCRFWVVPLAHLKEDFQGPFGASTFNRVEAAVKWISRMDQ